MGLMTAGKPTTSAAFATSAEDLIRWLAGVGRPARFMHALVFCRAQHSSSNSVVLSAAFKQPALGSFPEQCCLV